MLIFSSPRLIVTNLCGNFVTIKQTPLLVFLVFHKLVKFVGNASDLLFGFEQITHCVSLFK